MKLIDWLKHTEEHLPVASGVFRYELEFIHPSADDNGRRLWHVDSTTLEIAAGLPVSGNGDLRPSGGLLPNIDHSGQAHGSNALC